MRTEERGEGGAIWAGLLPAVGGSGPCTGPACSLVPGRAARRAGLAAQTRHYLPGGASLGTIQAGPKNRATGRAAGLLGAWPTVVAHHGRGNFILNPFTGEGL